jgi:hypothetical protein
VQRCSEPGPVDEITAPKAERLDWIGSEAVAWSAVSAFLTAAESGPVMNPLGATFLIGAPI